VAEDVTRVEIGFEGGLVIGMKLESAEWAKLEAALGGNQMVMLASEDTTFHVQVARVCYVRHDRQVARIGF
jgi:hypothetical protein